MRSHAMTMRTEICPEAYQIGSSSFSKRMERAAKYLGWAIVYRNLAQR